MSVPYFKANDLTHGADLTNLNRWVDAVAAELSTLRKLTKTLNVDKIDAAPERLVVNHVSIFQHYADPSDLQILNGADAQIQPLGENLPIDATADVVLTSTPTIASATREGQILYVHNVGTHTISLQDDAVLAGSTLDMYGYQVDLAPGDGIIFLYRRGTWFALSIAATSPRFGGLTVEGNAIFKGNVYQTNASKVVDIQNLLLRGTAVVLDKAGFRTAIDAAQAHHVHDFTASGSVPYSYVIPGAFAGLDGDGNPTFDPPTTVNVNIPFTIAGTTETERQP